MQFWHLTPALTKVPNKRLCASPILTAQALLAIIEQMNYPGPLVDNWVGGSVSSASGNACLRNRANLATSVG